MNKKEISVLAAFVILAVFSVLTGQIYEAQQIKDNTLRLHIIANSNSAADQRQKIYIRDRLLEMEDVLPSEAVNIDQAVSCVKGNLPVIESRINTILAEENAGYTSQCSVENFYFDTTVYNGFTLPEGEYTALTVRLGKAEGKNWWCVMYPALCSQSFGQSSLHSSSDFIKTEKPAARFKVVEIYESVKRAVMGSDTEKYENLK